MSHQKHADLLIEIGTEELPPAALRGLSEAFLERLTAQLDTAQLTHGGGRAYASPRRLAAVIEAVASMQPAERSTRRGPAVSAAFDATGTPTKAALGFARSCGVEVDALEREETDKGAWLVYRRERPGESAAALLPRLVAQALGELPIPRRMRWGEGDAEFVRPVHWICGLLGEQVLSGEVLGVGIGAESRGHRFHHPEPVPLQAPQEYVPALRAASVEPDFAARRASVQEQVEALAAEAGGRVAFDDALLDEVTALCEWPVALRGGFDPAFLQVPAEALVETMQKNQKYFPVRDAGGALLPCFIAVSNIASRDPDVVRAGNERVIRPRFADAKFFWEQDLKTPLEARLPGLDTMVFQQRLGSIGDKSRRVAELGARIAAELGADPTAVERAARLAKCDLLTSMVGEFGSLQGVMGRYYAAHAGEPAEVAAAIEEHYWPRHAGDRLPSGACGRCLALADRLDTLVGIFAIGQRPTGVKDPYALRRATIGALRILIETPLALDLRGLLAHAAEQYRGVVETEGTVEEVLGYCTERLKGYYAGAEAGHAAGGDVTAAVLSLGLTEPADLDRRIRAVQGFRHRPEAEALAAANKRTRNLLRKADPAEIGAGVRADLLRTDSERALALRLDELRATLAPLLAARDYDAALAALAGIRDEVDRFFDEVRVMDEDPALRANRLAILEALQRLFLGVADISLLQPKA